MGFPDFHGPDNTQPRGFKSEDANPRMHVAAVAAKELEVNCLDREPPLFSIYP